MIQEENTNTKKSSRPGRPASRRPEDAANSTVIIGIKLLQIIASSSRPETLTQIAKRANLTVSRTHRYLKSLTQSKFLKLDDETGKYTIGMAAIELGLAALSNIDALHLASVIMRNLSRETGFASTLSVWGSNGPTVIKSEDADFDISVRVRVGTNLSLPITAVGHIFLAYPSSDEVQTILKHDLDLWNAAATKRRKITEKSLEKIRKDVLKNGLSGAVGLRNSSIAALAAPVFGENNQLKMCLALIGVIDNFDADYSGVTAQKLKASAQRLSEYLGGDGIVRLN
jgi:DNA-binding IclR family transcriptional regulator